MSIGAIAGISGISAQLGTESATSVVRPGGGEGFAAHLDAAVGKVDGAQHTADSALAELASGENVDLHGTMMKLQQADISMRTMVTVRDKVVEAYQTIMNMTI
jgi:flagellar hook-basal body complex protein FliE